MSIQNLENTESYKWLPPNILSLDEVFHMIDNDKHYKFDCLLSSQHENMYSVVLFLNPNEYNLNLNQLSQQYSRIYH